ASEFANYLQRTGYNEIETEGAAGRFTVNGRAVELRPGHDSYFPDGNALRIEFGSREVRGIRSLANGASLSSAEVEPELLTNLFDSSREKRRPVRFDDLPKALVDAVLTAEDKRFGQIIEADRPALLARAVKEIGEELYRK